MNQETSSEILNYDDPRNKPKLTTGLNILTILTFVGCAYELYSSFKNYITGSEALDQLDKAQEKMESAPAWVKKFTGPEVREMMVKGIENKIPLIVLSLVSIALCIYGAIEMRKLKKQGYFIWLIGEVLPYIGTAIFVPMFFNTIFALLLIFPLLFIILYTIQKKNLKF